MSIRIQHTALWVALLALTGLAGCDDGGTPAPPVMDDGVTDMMITPDDGVDPDMTPDEGTLDEGVPADMGDMMAPDMEPPEPNPCEACETDEDCAPAGSVCAAIGEGLFCATPCDAGECELGFTCATVDEAEVCIPVRNSCGACEDADGDGYGVGPGCLGPDCADDNPDVNPGVGFDMCDGINNDCDDAADEDFESESCGIGACAAESRCEMGQVVECTPSAPAADDATCDGVDDDCDGNVDENYVPVECGVGVCIGMSACVDGVEQACAPIDAPAVDDATCDGMDDDCDGQRDEDFVGDSCGVGACQATGVCTRGEVSCEPLPPLADDDARCDAIDSDCDGNVDEDYTTDQTCGVGACRATGQCVNGAYACTPGEPLAANDATPDGVDDDCDGLLDEDAQQNRVFLRMVDRGVDYIDVEVVYEQVVSEAIDPTRYQPRQMELVLNHPAALSLRQPAHVEGIVQGPSLIESEKNTNVAGEADDRFRVIFLGLSALRVGPGVLCTFRFTFEAGLPGPFEFNWDLDRSAFAPEETNDILVFEGGTFGGQ